MTDELEVKELEDVVVRFSGDSGDGMQLAGNIFSTVSATVGNSISTLPDYPADIRAPQGSLTGVSGFQIHVGEDTVYTPGDLCDVLVAMNAAALKTQYRYAKPGATIIIDTDSFGPKDLEKAQFKTEDYLNAVAFVSYKLMGHSNQEAYFKTFPTRYQDMLAAGKSQKDISSFVSIYAKGKLVNLILEQFLKLVMDME